MLGRGISPFSPNPGGENLKSLLMEKCLSMCSECQMKLRIGFGFSIKLCSPPRGSQWSEEAVLYVKNNTTANSSSSLHLSATSLSKLDSINCL